MVRPAARGRRRVGVALTRGMSHSQQGEQDMSDQNAPGPHPLSGKVVLVTGGSRGIGAAVARRFASVGSRVAIGYRSGNAAAETVLGEIAALGAQGVAVAGDIAKPEDAGAMLAQVVARFGHIDVLVNCAGIAQNRP